MFPLGFGASIGISRLFGFYVMVLLLLCIAVFFFLDFSFFLLINTDKSQVHRILEGNTILILFCYHRVT